jgi:multicomponent Na+:H+ antiporter subunit B
MNRRFRMLVCLVGIAGIGVLVILSSMHMPHFGGSDHPYRDRAVPAAAQHQTANVISAVNFDQRALDTLGEETILLASVVGAVVLLRPGKKEREQQARPRPGRVLESTKFAGYVLLPLTLVLGVDIVAHGGITPGGGFQGGVVLATGLHLTYVSGSFSALERIRPFAVFEQADVLGAAGFVGLGLAGLAATSAFLANTLPLGHLGSLVSGGTVQLLSAAVGVEVASGVTVMLAQFFEQALVIRRREDGDNDGESSVDNAAAEGSA